MPWVFDDILHVLRSDSRSAETTGWTPWLLKPGRDFRSPQIDAADFHVGHLFGLDDGVAHVLAGEGASAISPLRTPRERAWPRPMMFNPLAALISPATTQILEVPISRPTMMEEESTCFLFGRVVGWRSAPPLESRGRHQWTGKLLDMDRSSVAIACPFLVLIVMSRQRRNCVSNGRGKRNLRLLAGRHFQTSGTERRSSQFRPCRPWRMIEFARQRQRGADLRRVTCCPLAVRRRTPTRWAALVGWRRRGPPARVQWFHDVTSSSKS